MKGGTLQINWHDTKPVLTLDFHPISGLLATAGADYDIKKQIVDYKVMEHTAEQNQEHEVYGGDIPDETEMDADIEMSRNETKGNENYSSKDLEDMKKRLKEIEDEAGALREMQAKVEKEMGSVQDWDSNFQQTMVEMLPLSSDDAAYGKIRGMLSTLGDPFTRIISPKPY